MFTPQPTTSKLKQRCVRGFNLIELMVSMAILAITISIGLPAFTDIIEEHRSQQVISLFYRLVQQSRNLAVTQNTTITLCKSQNLTSCGGNWKDGILVFADQDGDRAAGPGDTIYTTIKEPFEEGNLTWRSFGNKSYLQILPTGATNYQNGTFTYCIDPGDLKKARGISITVTGRPQMAVDRNGDGVRENSSGKSLRC